ncbi:MAG: hypothetical protein J6L69_02860 [Lachnospiraceae bacterium]|nr:hypothetical protein [Lachnospiraceae bacterium]
MNKESQNGIFWVIDGTLHTFTFENMIFPSAVAKSGNTYNHKLFWKKITNSNYFNGLLPNINCITYNYYPRGRAVVNSKGKVTIYMNPNIDESYIDSLKSVFSPNAEMTIKYDYSEHYKCHLDSGWKAEY